MKGSSSVGLVLIFLLEIKRFTQARSTEVCLKLSTSCMCEWMYDILLLEQKIVAIHSIPKSNASMMPHLPGISTDKAGNKTPGLVHTAQLILLIAKPTLSFRWLHHSCNE